MDNIISQDIEAFSERLKGCQWLFDLFAIGFDHLSKYFVPDTNIEQLDWETQTERIVKQNLGPALRAADGEIPEALWRFLRVPGNPESLIERPFLTKLFSLLQFIDKVSAEFNYFLSGVHGGDWRRVKAQLNLNGNLSRSVPGRVLLLPPTPFPVEGEGCWWAKAMEGEWEEIPHRGLHLYRLFQNLSRVLPIEGDCLISHNIVDGAAEKNISWTDLRIAIGPLAQGLRTADDRAIIDRGPLVIRSNKPGKFAIEIDKDQDPQFECRDLADAAEEIVHFASKHAVQLLVFPEMVVPESVVNRIGQVLKKLASDGAATPAITLAGTFTRQHLNKTGTEYNTAIVLDWRGERIWTQRKLHPYEMKSYEQKNFGLRDVLGGKDVTEDIECFPRELVFYDFPSAGLRALVTICEDACQAEPVGRIMGAMRPNLVLVPVMAGSLDSNRGFAKQADKLAREVGAMTIVGNSGALAMSEFRVSGVDGYPGLGVVAVPLLRRGGHSPLSILNKALDLSRGGTTALLFECPASRPKALR